MSNDVSIVIRAEDRYTDAMLKMANITSEFSKDILGLTDKLEHLRGNKVTLQADFEQAKRQVKETTKEFQKLGDELSKAQLEDALGDKERIKSNLTLVADELKRTDKAVRELAQGNKTYAHNAIEAAEATKRLHSQNGWEMWDKTAQSANDANRALEDLSTTQSKLENKAQSSGPGGGSTLAALSKAGLFNLLGQSATGMVGAGLGSLFGDTTGSAVSGILSGVVSGAALGSIAGIPGMIVGGAVGLVSGGINAVTEVFKSQDEAYKKAVQDLSATVTQEQERSLAAGSVLASDRERFKTSLDTLAGAQSEQLYADVKDFADVTPYTFDEVNGLAQQLLTGKFDPSEIVDKMGAIGDATATLGLGTDSAITIAAYMGRMNTTGRTNREFLDPLTERGIPAFDYLAKAAGTTREEIMEMMERGLIPGAEAAEVIAHYMKEDFSGGLEALSKTYAGLSSTLQGGMDDLDAAMGQGYNDERMKGMQAQIDFLSGDSGQAMREAYEKIGAFKASLENDKEALERDKLEDLFGSKAYLEAEAADQGRMIMEAQAAAVMEFATTDGAKMQHQAELDLIEGIRAAMTPEYWKTGWEWQEAPNKGMLASMANRPFPTPYWSEESASIQYTHQSRGRVSPTGPAATSGGNPLASPSSHAFGLERVPYDGYLAYLHQGERVQTAKEARSQPKSTDVNLNITGPVTVRSEEDLSRLADQITQSLRRARLLALPDE